VAHAVLAGRGGIGLRLNGSRFTELGVPASGGPKTADLKPKSPLIDILWGITSWCLLMKATALVMRGPKRKLTAGRKGPKPRRTIRRIDEDLGNQRSYHYNHFDCQATQKIANPSMCQTVAVASAATLNPLMCQENGPRAYNFETKAFRAVLRHMREVRRVRFQGRAAILCADGASIEVLAQGHGKTKTKRLGGDADERAGRKSAAGSLFAAGVTAKVRRLVPLGLLFGWGAPPFSPAIASAHLNRNTKCLRSKLFWLTLLRTNVPSCQATRCPVLAVESVAGSRQGRDTQRDFAKLQFCFGKARSANEENMVVDPREQSRPRRAKRVPQTEYTNSFLHGLQATGRVRSVGENWDGDASKFPPEVNWVIYPNGDLERIGFD
jgi:hypothetical protein